MGRVNIDYEALERFQRGPEVQHALKKGADAGRDAAKLMVSRRSIESGELLAGIESESEPGRARFGTNVNHGIFVEVGTQYMDAEPFIRTSFDEVRRALK